MGQTSPRRARDPFWALVATAKRLQDPGGCAWDRAQTVRSLMPYLIEETWEVFETVRNRRYRHLQEELGDVLYTTLFLTLVAERRGWASLASLLDETRRKMIRRHPHVFADKAAPTPQDAYRRWQASKRLERRTSPSPSKAFRQRLVAQWDALLTGWSRPPSGRPSRRRVRSRGRAPSRQTVG